MEGEIRKMGIDVIDAVPWGTHLCQFYDTKQDLIDIVVPYVKAGLENNEFCVWVTSEPLSEKGAEEALRKAVPDFTQYLERGQIDIVAYTEWYFKNGAFNLQRVLNAWIDKLNQALAKGYDGMRITGNTAWLEKREWRNFAEYEQEVNSVIGKYRMLAICTYPLSKCGASEIVEVMDNHQFASIRQAGNWVLLRPTGTQEVISQVIPVEPLTPLEEKFITSGFEGFSDEEIVELLLSLLLPRWKCKALAKKCIELFGNLRGFLAASAQDIERAGIGLSSMLYIKLLHELPVEVLKRKIIKQPVFSSSKEFFEYLQYSMRDLKKEVFKVIYLNNRNQIVDTADLFEGTLESIPIHPREIMEGAIKHDTTRLIFVHNHPTGDPTPSKRDKQLTRDFVFMGMILQIKVLDHIIIGEDKYFSFADEGLIQKYEDEFLNLRMKAAFDTGVGGYKDFGVNPGKISTLHSS